MADDANDTPQDPETPDPLRPAQLVTVENDARDEPSDDRDPGSDAPAVDDAAPALPPGAPVRPKDAPLEQSQLERLKLLIGDRLSLVIALAVASTVSGLCEAGILAVAAQAATALVNGGAHVRHGFGPLGIDVSTRGLLFVGIGLAVVRLVLQIPTSVLPAIIAGDVQATMRRRLIRAYLNGSWELQSQDREGYFQEMMTNQIQQASAGAMQATQLITYAFTFMIMVLSAFALNWIAAVAVFAAAVGLFGVLRPARSTATRWSRRLSAAQIEYAGAVGEANRVTEEIKVFGTSTAQVGRIDGFIARSRELFMKTQILARLVPNVYQSMIYFILVFGLLAADLAHVSGYSSLGAVVLLLVRAGTYGQQLQTALVAMRQSLPFAERLQNANDAYAGSAPPAGDASLDEIRTLDFDHVAYSYRADRPVLTDMSFSVNGGETIGVIGPSGAGKSTVVQLLLRLRAPQSGRFTVNGVDAGRIDADDWHERVAYVPQQPKLLHATVADNVRFYRDFDDAAVQRACRMARIHDEIVSWPAGYDTVVGPRADAVSGGQQQRICLARALISEPSLLVLDEPTSALDPRSEALIQESLESIHAELTLFIIAHRMSTLSICDRVMIVLDGSLNAFDRLSELAAGNDYYRFASGVAASHTRADLR